MASQSVRVPAQSLLPKIREALRAAPN